MAKSSTVEVSFFAETPDGGEIEVFVECTHYLGYPAKIDGPWESCYPSEPSSIEVLYASYEDGMSYDLNPDEHEKIRELVEEKVADNYEE